MEQSTFHTLRRDHHRPQSLSGSIILANMKMDLHQDERTAGSGHYTITRHQIETTQSNNKKSIFITENANSPGTWNGTFAVAMG